MIVIVGQELIEPAEGDDAPLEPVRCKRYVPGTRSGEIAAD
jgi:hypothetical protein